MEQIKKDIVSGKLKGGDKMPSVRALAKELQVNVNTVQRVYQELERDNILFSQRGIGSFVTENKETIEQIKEEMAHELLENFVHGMRELGFDDKSTLLALQQYMGREAQGNVKD
ncbi:MAG: GntR family transcriptional regulator [Clostridia bacterium]|nr:GntR family transcriptional regulator [Clostridia bacterium]